MCASRIFLPAETQAQVPALTQAKYSDSTSGRRANNSVAWRVRNRTTTSNSGGRGNCCGESVHLEKSTSSSTVKLYRSGAAL
ncbi:hypothetical protein RRG08_002939 [Elysia crispata]|uniref:Uncharacterized protein n=1 Tax=Elysia crispata TaxID=231223 RepID=A0AAE1APR7_9GAST|nr:hypothetical protein RRG08_002939 [Elysia crispata]